MNLKNYTFFDTDLQIHKLDTDQPVREAAEKEFSESRPTAMSAFSLLELKGNYIQNLVLLRRKINDSDSLSQAFSKIKSCGGKKGWMMLTQLISCMSIDDKFHINPWIEAKRLMVTILDSQIVSSWREFQTNTDMIVDHFNCVRAFESPKDHEGKWTATISQCTNNNTKCNINEFIKKRLSLLKKLISEISKMPPDRKSKEL